MVVGRVLAEKIGCGFGCGILNEDLLQVGGGGGGWGFSGGIKAESKQVIIFSGSCCVNGFWLF